MPVVIQDDSTNEVLMVAFMNEEALRQTRETGYTHFYSRSRCAIWRKGEQSGHVQEVRDIFVNCEENSLLIRVRQVGEAACHTGYRSCFYRRLQPDDSYETIAERIFDPEVVYQKENQNAAGNKIHIAIDYNNSAEPEKSLRQLYRAYLYLREHDLSEQSNTSRLLQENNPFYLAARVADELQELADVQTGEHAHTGREQDTILEASQVGYWLMLIAATYKLPYDEFIPHEALMQGYSGKYTEEKAAEMQDECLQLLSTYEPAALMKGIQLGFILIGWACAGAGVNPLAPAQFDLEQMRRKGLVKE